MSNERIDSRDIISDYIFYSKYSRVKPDGKKETWPESVSRVMEMHYEFSMEKSKMKIKMLSIKYSKRLGQHITIKKSLVLKGLFNMVVLNC